ncbi:hypothetical protein AYK24_09965 [Thermoplasmatales archaeon SG8-52-4]|nr:MAG: hypothetical protein AYK24_09965 [Thermoplasmatales archaeon SG8-52-4]
MRKILPLIVVGIMVLSGLGAVASTSDDQTELKITSVSFLEPKIEIEKDFTTIHINEANSYIMKQGKPMLPSYAQTYTFPLGTKIKSVVATPKNIQTIPLSKEIKPTPQAVIVGQTISSEKIVNYGNEPYPENWFQYDVGCGLIDGELSIILETEICPVKYYPAKNSIDWANEVEITIQYEKTPIPIKQSSNEQYELVIIAPDEFSDELAPLVSHKIGRGITTKFSGLSEVYSTTGRDYPEKIKYYIKDAIETWDTTNILLVGSWHDYDSTYQKIPVRPTHIESTDPPDDEVFISDLYYADIYDGELNFCSWDSNDNDVFGEMLNSNNIDNVDLHPDVYYGRIPSRNGGEVTTIVNKIMTYENNEAYTQDWFTNLVVVGGDTSPDYDTLEGEYVNQKVIDMMDGFSSQKIWASNGKLTGWVPTGVQSVKDAINPGCGFVDFSGHGNTNVWATHPEGSHDWIPTPSGYLVNDHIESLTNGNKLPIIAVEACSTAKFNKDDRTFNYAFLRNPNGGGIGAFGATGLGWGYVGTGIVSGLIGKMGLDTFRAYRYDGAITLGEMWLEALERYIKSGMDALDFKTVEEWQIFGDPTLQIAEESNAPLKPSTPNGPSSGKIGNSYTYTSSTTDPDGDKISYKWDWGDGTFSDWSNPIDSGSMTSASKSWTTEGEFEIRVAAKDTHGKVSDWSNPLIVTMPRTKAINNPILDFLQSHPNLFPILQFILQQLGLY